MPLQPISLCQELRDKRALKQNSNRIHVLILEFRAEIFLSTFFYFKTTHTLFTSSSFLLGFELSSVSVLQ